MYREAHRKSFFYVSLFYLRWVKNNYICRDEDRFRMKEQKISKMEYNFAKAIKEYELYDVIVHLKKECEELKDALLISDLENVVSLYKQFAYYIAQGTPDKEQKRVIVYLQKTLLEIADRIRFRKNRRDNGGRYYQIINVRESVESASITELSTELLEKKNLIVENRKFYDGLVEHLFEALWTTRSLSDQEMLLMAQLPETIRLSLCAAITLSFHECWDLGKIRFILRELSSIEVSVAYRIRLVWALIMVASLHRDRLPLFEEELTPLLQLANDVYPLEELLRALFVQYVLALKSDKVADSLGEKSGHILQQMQEHYQNDFSPLSEGNGVSDEELFNLISSHEEDKDFQKLEEEMQQLSQMEEEGIDMVFFHFKNLKQFPFFEDLSHWFLPFDPSHYSTAATYEHNKQVFEVLLPIFEQRMCDSDLYSLMQTWSGMVAFQGNPLVEQMQHFVEESQEKGIPSPRQELVLAAKKYVENLFRFYELYSGKRFFVPNPFQDGEFLRELPLIRPYVERESVLEAAAYSFSKYGFYPQAIDMLNQLSTFKKQDPAIYSSIGYNYMMLGNYDEAIKNFLLCDLIGGSRISVMKQMAYCYRKSNRLDEALEVYRRIGQLSLSSSSSDNEELLSIATIQIGKKQYKDALRTLYQYEFTVQKEFGKLSLYRLLSWCLLLDQQYEQALQYNSRLVALATSTTTDWLNRGHIFLGMNDTQQAVQSYQKSIELGNKEVWKEKMKEDKADLLEAGVAPFLWSIVYDAVQLSNSSL